MSDTFDAEGPEADVPETAPSSDTQLPTAPPVEVLPVVSAPTQAGTSISSRELGGRGHRLLLSGAEKFWYVLQCVLLGAGYFGKIPTKKALSEAGLVTMSAALQFWYVLQCLAFGWGYFAKVPMRKALEDAGLVTMSAALQFWYVLQCLAFGAGYLAKVVHKKALSELPTLPVLPASA